jgi:subtilisin family serine protease
VASVQAPALGATVAPSDYFYMQSSQWGLDRIKALSAWSVSRGAGATVALIDTGADMNHVDLKGKLLGGMNYVEKGSAPNDNQGHGTLMAGIVGALTDNKDANGAGIGVASVAPLAKILPVRWVSRDGTGLKGDPKDAAAGIRWSLTQASPSKLVIVLGWDWPGAQGSLGTVEGVYADPDVQSAIADAAAAGAVVVLAAGNNGGQAPAYNPSIPGVVVVGETTQQDGLASGANAGAQLLAPGKDIVSTYWDSVGSFPCPQHAKTCNADERKYESIYAVGEGTSLGAAHVAGVAALMVGKGGFGNNAAVVDKLIASGEKLGGSKLLDAAAALGAKIEAPIIPPPPPGGATSSPPPLVVSGPGGTGTSSSPTPGKTTKPTTSGTKGARPAGASTPAPPGGGQPMPGTTAPGADPSTGTGVVTPSQGAPAASKPVPLNGPATFLASGLNMVAGAIDYTGGLVKQIDVWEGLAALSALVFVYECSAWIVRRRQLRGPGGKDAGPGDARP